MSRMPVSSIPNHEQFAAHLAQVITGHGLRQPALLILDAGRPLVFLVAQLFYVAQPALALFWPYNRLERLGQFLEDPQALMHLLACLEVD